MDTSGVVRLSVVHGGILWVLIVAAVLLLVACQSAADGDGATTPPPAKTGDNPTAESGTAAHDSSFTVGTLVLPLSCRIVGSTPESLCAGRIQAPTRTTGWPAAGGTGAPVSGG